MNNGNYENKLIDAIEAIVGDAVQNASYDKTIQATIVECVDSTIGQYRVKYQDSIFIAYAVGADIKYKKDTQVYVLIPGNDMSEDKTILGSVEKLGINYIVEPDKIDMFEMIGNNCIIGKDTFELSSYSSNFSQVLYDKNKTNNLLKIDKTGLENYIIKSSSLLCGADFKITLPQEQRVYGQYGIIFELTFKDNNTGKLISRNYTFGSGQITGDPYYVPNYKNIKYIYDIDGNNFVSLDKITLFVKDFPHRAKDKPADIFIKNLEFCGGVLRGDEIYGCILNIITPQGAYFNISDKETTEKILEAEVKLNGQVVNKDSQALEYYWFKENVKITSNSNKYCPYGKEGWECLNEYTPIGVDPITGKQLVKWVPGNYSIKTTKAENPAKETRYKCVVLYQDYKPEREVKIINSASNFNISIVSDKGTNFQYDIGNPTLTCLINDVVQVNENLEYIWARSDDNISFTSLLENEENNNNYNNVVSAYNQLQNDIKNEIILPQAAEIQLKQLEEDIKNYNTFVRPEKNVLHNININSITNEATFKCSVYQKGVLIGTGSIILYNNLNPNNNEYTLMLKNKTQVFKYNAKGISPTHTFVEGNVFELQPLTFDIKDINGDILEWETLKNGIEIEWLVPKNNTMISIVNKYASSGESGEYLIYRNFKEIEYLINKEYDIFKNNNNILLRIKYKNAILTDMTNFSFIKEGDPGTNGTEYVCKIVPNTTQILNEYPMILNNKLNFIPIDENKWFKIQLWKNGNLIFNGLTGLSSENKHVELSWSILTNNYGKDGSETIKDDSWLIVDNQGNFSYNRDENIKVPANIIKCTVTYNGVQIPVTLPLITAVSDANYDIKLKYGTGFPYAVYSADGRLPIYNTIPFELIINKNINEFKEDISKLTINNEKVKYNWTRLGNIKTWTNGNIVEQDTNLFLLNDKDENNFISEYGDPYLNVKPKDEYDGWSVNGALKCIVKNNNTQIAEIHIPVHLLLNRYGQSALNDWDGNHISIDKDGSGVILAPQIGAGQKEADNSFTGMLMGKIKEANHENTDVGLFGYNNGTRSLFLNSKDGSAIFGKAGKGQIIFDPQQNSGLIYSSNFWKEYKEDGKPINYDISNETGEGIPNESGDQHTAAANQEYGMLINLTKPEIRWGNKNFIVNKFGHLTARGGGEIAGWEIDDYQIKSNDTKTGMNSVYIIDGTGSRTKDIQLPNGNTRKAVAFWAGEDKFFATHDGYIRMSDATIGSGSNLIYIGKNGNESVIHTYGKNTLTDTTDGFYIGTDGISLGNNNNFIVTKEGNMSGQKWSITNQGIATFENLIANKEGYIAGWKISSNSLSNSGIEINSNGSIKHTGGRWSINGDGTASFGNGLFKVNKDNVTIGGWIVGKDELYNGNLHLDSSGNLRGGENAEGKNYWKINSDGTASFTYIIANIGGNIGGWKIDGTTLKSQNGKIALQGNGNRIKWNDGNYFFSCGYGTSHPSVSGLNVKTAIGFYSDLTVEDFDRDKAKQYMGAAYLTKEFSQGNALCLKSNGGVGVALISGEQKNAFVVVRDTGATTIRNYKEIILATDDAGKNGSIFVGTGELELCTNKLVSKHGGNSSTGYNGVFTFKANKQGSLGLDEEQTISLYFRNGIFAGASIGSDFVAGTANSIGSGWGG